MVLYKDMILKIACTRCLEDSNLKQEHILRYISKRTNFFLSKMKTKVGEVYTLNTFQNVKCLKCISDT